MRTGPLLKRIVPWKLWRAETSVEAMAVGYGKQLTALRLADLPSRPSFLFLATDMASIPMWYSTAQFGWSDKVTGVKVTAFGTIDFSSLSLK